MKLVLQGIESGTAGELLAGEARGSSAMAFLDAPGWATRLVVYAPRATIASIVESLLGGDGSQAAQAMERPLSKIEVGIAGVFFASIAKGFAAAFVPIAPASSILPRRLTSPISSALHAPS